MVSINEKGTVTNVVKFVKEQGVWYVNLLDLLSMGGIEKASLMITEDIATMLNSLSEDGPKADLLISTAEFVGYEGFLQLSDTVYTFLRTNNSPLSEDNPQGIGTASSEENQKDCSFNKQGFQPIAQYVFNGEYPEKMYIKVVNTRTGKARKTIYHLLVDKSNSMRSCMHNIENAILEQKEKINQLQEKYTEEEITFGFSTFTSEVRDIIEPSSSASTSPFDDKKFYTGHFTALLDAIGLTVKKLGDIQAKEELRIPTSVVLIVITDGEENHSSLFSFDNIKDTIERLQKTGKWAFNFLGADINAFDISPKRAMFGPINNADNKKDGDNDNLGVSCQHFGERSKRMTDYPDRVQFGR